MRNADSSVLGGACKAHAVSGDRIRQALAERGVCDFNFENVACWGLACLYSLLSFVSLLAWVLFLFKKRLTTHELKGTQTAVVKERLRHASDSGTKNNDSQTGLHVAVVSGRQGAALVVVASGAALT